eukprot:TRINITY_DN6574_c0_g2_i2.p3 TRINITY_DN6574_c0_g2~~TRINITY_DN6574_c0_g2_i2.p3  ORF type:complete len:108 (+),score=17.92 TRINITY_DN6574_c0_g2_i2:276-599(+)
MPTHTFLRVGRYNEVYVYNAKAHQEELKLGERCVATYFPEHNALMGIYGASMSGQYEKAAGFAIGIKTLRAKMPATYQAPGVDWVTYPLLMIRFAQEQLIEGKFLAR